jgi:hypothetical protein
MEMKIGRTNIDFSDWSDKCPPEEPKCTNTFKRDSYWGWNRPFTGVTSPFQPITKD